MLLSSVLNGQSIILTFLQFSHYYFPMLSICPLMCIQCVNDYRSIYFQVVYSCFCNVFLTFVAFLLQLLSCIQFDYFVVTDACLFHSIEGCTHLMCTATLSSRCLLCSTVTNAESVYFFMLPVSMMLNNVPDVLLLQCSIIFFHLFWQLMVSFLYCYQICYSWWPLHTIIISTSQVMMVS